MDLFEDDGGRGSSKRQRMMSNDEPGLSPNHSGGGMSNGGSPHSHHPHPHHAQSVDALSAPPVKQARTSRARSDSAPLGYPLQPGGGLGPWGAGGVSGRPRSGSGLTQHPQGQRGIPNIGNMTRGMSGPGGVGNGGMSLGTVPSNAPSR